MAGWQSLQAIIDYAKQLGQNPPPEVACPYCGEPLIKGHCNWDGYTSGEAQTQPPPR